MVLRRGAKLRPSNEFYIKVAKLPLFDREASKVRGFIMACRLYINMRMRKMTVEVQIQWVLIYMQGDLADVWKQNILENSKTGMLEFKTVGEILKEIKKEFGGDNEELVKITKLKQVE